MSTYKRIEHLSNVPLTEDLLKLLFNARVMLQQGQEKRADALLNIIERVCDIRGIKIYNWYTSPRMLPVRGSTIDIRI